MQACVHGVSSGLPARAHQAAGRQALQVAGPAGSLANRRPAASVATRAAGSSQLSRADESLQILEGFYYGRAFAITLSRRLGELVVEVVSDVSKTIAEQPQRWEEFQEEVEQLALKEMGAAAAGRLSSSSSSSSTAGSSLPSSSTGSGSSSGQADAGIDLEAIVDELRADIAQSRAILAQLRSSTSVASPSRP